MNILLKKGLKLKAVLCSIVIKIRKQNIHAARSAHKPQLFLYMILKTNSCFFVYRCHMA
jgi:hypothetical protein